MIEISNTGCYTKHASVPKNKTKKGACHMLQVLLRETVVGDFPASAKHRVAVARVNFLHQACGM